IRQPSLQTASSDIWDFAFGLQDVRIPKLKIRNVSILFFIIYLYEVQQLHKTHVSYTPHTKHTRLYKTIINLIIAAYSLLLFFGFKAYATSPAIMPPGSSLLMKTPILLVSPGTTTA